MADKKEKLAYGMVEPPGDLMENAKAQSSTDKNRHILLGKLDDETYLLYMRSVYSGPSISRTRRRISKDSMTSLVHMWMRLNNITQVKIEDGALMARGE